MAIVLRGLVGLACLVAWTCAKEHKTADLANQAGYGGPSEDWVYTNTAGDAICIKSMGGEDICLKAGDSMNQKDANGQASIKLKPCDDWKIKHRGSKNYTQTYTAKEGATGLVGPNGDPFTTKLLDTTQDPLKGLISKGKLHSSFYTQYANVKLGKDVKITAFSEYLYDFVGWVDFAKVTVCSEVYYREVDAEAPYSMGAKCNVKRLFKLVSIQNLETKQKVKWDNVNTWEARYLTMAAAMQI